MADEKKEIKEEIIEEAPTDEVEEVVEETTEEPVDEEIKETPTDEELKKKKKKKIIIIVSIVIALLLITGVVVLLLIKDKKDNKTEEKKTDQITITFDTNGGNKIEPLKVDKNGRVNYPIPERENHLFTGWYNVEEKVLRTTTFDKDVTLTAHWEELKSDTKTMVVTYDTQGNGHIDSETIICGSPIDIPAYFEIPDYEDYYLTLEKWVDEKGNEVVRGSILPCKDVTIKAIWSKEEKTNNIKCPDGYWPSDDKRCYQTAKPILKCINNTTESYNTCLDYNDTVEGERVCTSWAYIHKEDGSITNFPGEGEYFDGNCGYYVLKGYTQDMCVKKYDEGPVWANGKCYATVEEQGYETKCPEGYSYNFTKDTCIRDHQEYASCPEGYEKKELGSLTCIRYTDPIE